MILLSLASKPRAHEQTGIAGTHINIWHLGFLRASYFLLFRLVIRLLVVADVGFWHATVAVATEIDSAVLHSTLSFGVSLNEGVIAPQFLVASAFVCLDKLLKFCVILKL